MTEPKNILFVCVENAGRSQMAEAFFKKYAKNQFNVISAGTSPSSHLNPVVVSVMNELGIDLESVNIEDLGNTRHTVVAIEMIDMLRKITTELVAKQRQLFILGGEHSITYGTYTSFPKETGYVVFDAHYDLRDEFADIKLSHASYLRRIVEERGAENILHVGA